MPSEKELVNVRPTARRWPKSLLVAAVVSISLISTNLKSADWTTSWSGIKFGSAQLKQDKSWDWAAIGASRDLQWHACYGGDFACARLDVPLDWLDPTEEQRVVLAVLRYQAKTTADYRGPVFINPGGPGGSGVSFLKEHARELQTIVGDNHDVISFDPRGIGASVPRIDCWGATTQRHDWELLDQSVIDAYPGLLYEAYARAQAFSEQCESYMNTTTPDLLRHVSTASHARDMLEISDKAGFPRLKYWGFSYGTILGGTFAAMFPDRVERLVSDGNVDYHDWFSLEQLNFIEDSDKIMEKFFTACSHVGQERCPFALESPAAVQLRYVGLLDKLRKKPVVIPALANGTGPAGPELVTYAKFQLLIRGIIYKPLHGFPALAKAMVALEQGDGLPFYNMANSQVPTLDFCALNNTSPLTPVTDDDTSSWDAFPAIMCADGEPFTDTPDEFAAYVDALIARSKYAGPSNVHFKVSCAGRTIRPKFREAGPWHDVETQFPILFIGNMADNVTPLQSARNNSAKFPGSALLVQNSYGHCSLAAPSTCTAQTVRAYFQNGTLPEPGAECEQDYDFFQEPRTVAFDASNEDEDMAILSRAIAELSYNVDFRI